MGKKIAIFKHEDVLDGEPVGPVFIADDEDPENVESLDWMPLSAARELASERGYEFTED